MIAQLEKISKHYKNEISGKTNVVLNNLSLDILEGDSIAVTGPSGSGKSTLLNILGTIDVPTSGKVFLMGDDISKLPPKQIASVRNKNIGFVFQVHHLLPQLSLLENVLVPVIPVQDDTGKKRHIDRANELLKRVGLHNITHQRPAQCSVGECQRAAVVRALINEPELILADEPTGSLDQETALKMGELLVQINEEFKVAMVVVTHSNDLAKQMRVIYELKGGNIHRKP